MSFRAGLHNFSKGILSKELWGRVDIAPYSAGVRQALNVLIMKYGGLTKRPGTHMVYEVRDGDKRLLPFEGAYGASYALLMGEETMRPAALGGMVPEASKAVTAGTGANPVALTVAAHGYVTGDEVFVSGSAGMAVLNGRILPVTVTGANSFTLPIDTSSLAPIDGTDGMTVARIYKIATPYSYVDLTDMDYTQAFDIMYLAHADHDPGKLVRTGNTAWAHSSVTFGPTIGSPTGLGATAIIANTDSDNDGNGYFPQPATYVVTAVNDASGQESRASSSASATNDLTLKRNKNVISWSAPAGVAANRYRVYKADNQQDYGFIGTTDSLSFTDDNIAPDLTDGPPEAFNPFAGGNRPSSVTFFEQRLFWGRTNSSPSAVYGSRTADFENYDIARPLKEDDAITFRIMAQKVNAVNSLVPMENLLALTSDAVFKIMGSNTDYLAASPPPRALRQSGRGASRLKPIIMDEVIFYQPAVGSEVRSLGFSFDIDGYKSNDVSIFSPGLFRGFSFPAWTYAQEPLSVLFAVRSDGKMPSFTWQQEQQVWGWTLCETQGEIIDACAIAEQNENRVYLLVRRTIAGVERLFLERMASAKWSDVKQACYLDCSLSFSPSAPTSIFHVPHLAGATVDALADGFVIKGLVVGSDGMVDLSYDATDFVTIGLPYDALIETLPLVLQTREGWSRDKRQMLGEVVLQLTDTRHGSIQTGRRLEKMYPIKARRNEPLGQPTDLFTGSVSASTEPVTSGEATLFVRSSDPTPMTVTAIYLDPIVSEN
ncbi:MAG TPA: hypothetical protein VJM09_02265 [Sphingobium sp.]|nr:hypothetical protein [Sphingobium sp.]